MTGGLRLLVLLVEVERQAAIFSDGLAEAVEAGSNRGDVNAAWRHLQGALFAAIVVNRLVTDDGLPPRKWPWLGKSAGQRAALAAASWRASELRRLLALPVDEKKTLIFGVRAVRNDLEHVDARLDLAINSPGVASISDWYLSDGVFLTTVEGTTTGPYMAGLRGFWPEAGLLLFNRSPLDLFALDVDMHRLRHNAREAQAELLQTLNGRLNFGRQKIEDLRSQGVGRHAWWQQMTTEIQSSMAPPVDLDTYVRMWAQMDDA